VGVKKMFYVYVLRSVKSQRFYTGHTDDVDDRLVRHNQDRVPSTRKRGPWVLLFTREFETRAEAVQFERYLKSLKGNKTFRRIIGVE
jgi:putative endonuclease